MYHLRISGSTIKSLSLNRHAAISVVACFPKTSTCRVLSHERIVVEPLQKKILSSSKDITDKYDNLVTSTYSSEATVSLSPSYDSFNPIPLKECEEMVQTAERAARAAGDIIVEHLGCSSEASTGDQKQYQR
jgi:hypothetical protein